MRAGVRKAKLKHRHTGDLKTVTKRMHFRRNVAQVLGEERQPTEDLTQFLKNIVLRTIHPAAVDCGGFAGRNFPELFKAPKMIQANVIAILSRPMQPLHPPFIPA